MVSAGPVNGVVDHEGNEGGRGRRRRAEQPVGAGDSPGSVGDEVDHAAGDVGVAVAFRRRRRCLRRGRARRSRRRGSRASRR